MKTFYTYLWLRHDGTPYYAGKGNGDRALRKGAPKDSDYKPYRYTPEAKERIRAARRGKTISAETREKLSEMRKGKLWTEARREANQRKWGIGKRTDRVKTSEIRDCGRVIVKI